IPAHMTQGVGNGCSIGSGPAPGRRGHPGGYAEMEATDADGEDDIIAYVIVREPQSVDALALTDEEDLLHRRGANPYAFLAAPGSAVTRSVALQDSFDFIAVDAAGATSNVATVTLSVILRSAPNEPPFAANTTVHTLEGEPCAGRFNSTDTDSAWVVHALTREPRAGTVVITDVWTGGFTYTPDGCADSSDTFGYSVTDAQGMTATAEVEVVIAPINDVPAWVCSDAPSDVAGCLSFERHCSGMVSLLPSSSAGEALYYVLPGRCSEPGAPVTEEEEVWLAVGNHTDEAWAEEAACLEWGWEADEEGNVTVVVVEARMDEAFVMSLAGADVEDGVVLGTVTALPNNGTLYANVVDTGGGASTPNATTYPYPTLAAALKPREEWLRLDLAPHSLADPFVLFEPPSTARGETYTSFAWQITDSGNLTSSYAVDVILRCRPGYHMNGTQCSACPPGQLGRPDEWDAPACEQCAPGTAAAGRANIGCTSCTKGTYQPAAGAGACSQCPANMSGPAEATSLEQCRCVPGFWQASTTECVECSSGCEVCDEAGQGSPKPFEGYWVAPLDPFTVLECIPAEACPALATVAEVQEGRCGPQTGNGNSARYEGRRCEYCSAGNARWVGRCEGCQRSQQGNQWLAGLVAAALLVGAGPVLAAMSTRHHGFATINTVLDYLQITGSMRFFGEMWPQRVRDVLAAHSFFSLSPELLELECFLDRQDVWTSKYTGALWGTLLALVSVLLYFAIKAVFASFRDEGGCTDVLKRSIRRCWQAPEPHEPLQDEPLDDQPKNPLFVMPEGLDVLVEERDPDSPPPVFSLVRVDSEEEGSAEGDDAMSSASSSTLSSNPSSSSSSSPSGTSSSDYATPRAAHEAGPSAVAPHTASAAPANAGASAAPPHVQISAVHPRLDDEEHRLDHLASSLLLLLTWMCSPMLESLLLLFQCRKVEEACGQESIFVLKHQPNIPCWDMDGIWGKWVGLGIAGLIMTAAIPAILFAVLHRHRPYGPRPFIQVMTEDTDETEHLDVDMPRAFTFHRRFGMLYSDFNAKWYMWQVLIIVRRMAIASLVLFNDHLVQLALVMLIVGSFNSATVSTHAFRTPHSAFVSVYTNMGILGVTGFGIVFSLNILDETNQGIMEGSLLTFFSFTYAFFLLVLLLDLSNGLRDMYTVLTDMMVNIKWTKPGGGTILMQLAEIRRVMTSTEFFLTDGGINLMLKQAGEVLQPNDVDQLRLLYKMSADETRLTIRNFIDDLFDNVKKGREMGNEQAVQKVVKAVERMVQEEMQPSVMEFATMHASDRECKELLNLISALAPDTMIQK
ncbi:hypothetical protein CYMTET_33578, partial [Cymbomonas tetramitiformis]